MKSVYRPLEHDRLVQLIYDCAEEPHGLDPALEEIAAQLGAIQGHTLVFENRVELAESHTYGHDPAAFARYDTDWREKDPRFALAVAHPGQVFSDVAVIEPTAFEESALCNEFLLKNGVRYTLFTTVESGPNLMTAQAFLRAKEAGPFGAAESAKFERLLPHLCRATRLRHLVRSMRSDVTDLHHALDVVPAPVALLDRSGKVLCANAAAKQLLDARDGIRMDRGTLTASSPTEARAILSAVAQSAALADAGKWRPPPSQLAPTVTISREHGGPVAVVFFVLRPRNQLRDSEVPNARVLAVFHDPARLLRLNPVLVAKLHGLTPTEAVLAAAIAEGQTLADFAIDRGCTEQTARSHLKRVLDKTGTNRQADLVRVLLTGAANHYVQ